MELLPGGLRERFRAAWRGLQPRLAVDPRALAALRVALALLVLADLLLRASDLVAFTTDAGALPRAALAGRYPLFHRLSLHAFAGDAAFQGLLFALAGAFALALLLGYRTRAATAGTFLLRLSLDLRNPLVLNGGDGVQLVLLAWALFLPLGARWSLDAGAAGPPPRAPVATAAAAALLLHVVLVYVVNAAAKLRAGNWVRGDALAYTVRVEHFHGLLALPREPLLLTLAGWAWLALLLASPLLMLTTGRRRLVLVALFAGAQATMALTMRLGLFPLVSLAALLPFLPLGVWDAVEARVAAWDVRWPASRRSRWTTRPALAAGGRPGVVASLVAVSLAWHAASIGDVELPGAAALEGPQGWVMFADPHRANAWLVAPGTLAGGGVVDALHGGEVSWQSPPRPSSVRWLEYFEELDRLRADDLLPPLARYLCERWNAEQAPRLLDVELHRVERPIVLEGPEPSAAATPLLRQTC